MAQDIDIFDVSEDVGVEVTARILYLMATYPNDPKKVKDILLETYRSDSEELEYALFTYGYWIGIFSADEYYTTAKDLYGTVRVLVTVANYGYEEIKEYVRELFTKGKEMDIDTSDYKLDYIM